MSRLAIGQDGELSAVRGELVAESGIELAEPLVAFVEAVLGGDDEELSTRRHDLEDIGSSAALVDASAIIAFFSMVNRIADSTGISLDDSLEAMSVEVRQELGL